MTLEAPLHMRAPAVAHLRPTERFRLVDFQVHVARCSTLVVVYQGDLAKHIPVALIAS